MIEREVSAHLSNCLNRWMREEWEPRVVKLLRDADGAPARAQGVQPPGPAAEESAKGTPVTSNIEISAVPVRLVDPSTATTDEKRFRGETSVSQRRKRATAALPPA